MIACIIALAIIFCRYYLFVDSLKTLFATRALDTIWNSLFDQLLCSISITAELLTLLKIKKTPLKNPQTKMCNLFHKIISHFTESGPNKWTLPNSEENNNKTTEEKTENLKIGDEAIENLSEVWTEMPKFSFRLLAILNFGECWMLIPGIVSSFKHKSHLTTRAPHCTLLTIFHW